MGRLSDAVRYRLYLLARASGAREEDLGPPMSFTVGGLPPSIASRGTLQIRASDVATVLGRYPGAYLIEDLDEGLVRLSSGAITDPVAYVDLTLPVGYVKFGLEFSGLAFGSADAIWAVALSFDGNLTFLADIVHSDTYVNIGAADYRANIQTGVPYTPNTLQNPDAVITAYARQSDVPARGFVYLDLWPGNGTSLASGRFETTTYGAINFSQTFGAFTLNPAAIEAPPLSRTTGLRFLPYGNDVDPPTSGETITAGSYVLWGLKP